ncbi:MAG TPA: hypothetical protein PLV83_05125 [Bacilli bacterium]|nr:hypothetical protein [Bacilli bacterium]
MNYINQHEFYLETNGKIIDMDGLYGGQCWDLFSYYTKKLCGKIYSCIETGYVIDLWNKFYELGLNEYFEKVTDNYQDGDWMIWNGPIRITSKSHIAMFRKDNGDNTNVILTQNPNGNPNYTHQMIYDYIGVVGALRPKIYIENKVLAPNPVDENNLVDQVYVSTSDTVYCRTSPDETIDNKVEDSFTKEGYYNILSETDSNNYHWYQIDIDRWVASIPNYVTYIPKVLKNGHNFIKKIINYIRNIIIKLIKLYKQ